MAIIRTVQQYLDTIQERFRPEAARGFKGVFQMNLSGPGAATFHLIIDGATLTLGQGVHRSPTTTLTASADDYVKLVNGTLSGERAVLTRRLKVSGDLQAAMALDKIIPRG